MEETCLRNKIGVRERDAEIQRGWRLEWNKAVKYLKTLAEYGNSDKHANFIYILYRDDLQETVNLFRLLSLWLDSLYPWHLCIATTVNTATQHLSTSLYSSTCFNNDSIFSNAPWATSRTNRRFNIQTRYVIRCYCIHAKECLKMSKLTKGTLE